MAKAEMTWAAALAEAGCYSFLEPVASQAVDKAMELASNVAPLVTGDARKDLRDMCLQRLAIVYERSIMQLAVGRAGLFGMISLHAKDDARAEMMRGVAEDVREELSADGGASLRSRLPMAAGYERAVADNLSKAMAEFFGRMLLKRDEISRKLLDGRPIVRVTGVSAGDADSHCHGRMVMRIETDAGQFYYKPHDCRLDALFLELAGTWFSGSIRAAELVPGDGYAFIERLVAQGLSCETDLRAYWRNFGCLAALFHGLGSRDMTQDNIMCCGMRPAVLDLETLLMGEIAFEASVPTGNAAIREIPADMLADSVFCTAILPVRVNGSVVSPLVAEDASGACLPRLRGERRTVHGYEQDFSVGFEEGYRHLMECREEVLALLRRYGDATCRHILINTWAYSKSRSLLFSPHAMADQDTRDEVLEGLNVKYDAFSATLRRAVAAPDAAALEEGDIPYYCSRVASRTLYAGDGRNVGEFLTRSALEVATRRLERLSEEDLRFELDLIRGCLEADALSGDGL